ncbi:MAG: hypothetical protein MJ072_05420, partial [Clostridia bacterium]|nr:hypothetical protein [Clostridia bacterium]
MVFYFGENVRFSECNAEIFAFVKFNGIIGFNPGNRFVKGAFYRRRQHLSVGVGDVADFPVVFPSASARINRLFDGDHGAKVGILLENAFFIDHLR